MWFSMGKKDAAGLRGPQVEQYRKQIGNIIVNTEQLFTDIYARVDWLVNTFVCQPHSNSVLLGNHVYYVFQKLSNKNYNKKLLVVVLMINVVGVHKICTNTWNVCSIIVAIMAIEHTCICWHVQKHHLSFIHNT